jgi:DNA-binding transcriptional ArsR family regulator
MELFYDGDMDIKGNKLKRWVVVYSALANINRLKIIEMLSESASLSVTEISQELGISIKATSNHLAILRNADVLEAKGTAGRVLYSVNKNMPNDFREAIGLF